MYVCYNDKYSVKVTHHSNFVFVFNTFNKDRTLPREIDGTFDFTSYLRYVVAFNYSYKERIFFQYF